jgi:hypothetical protein
MNVRITNDLQSDVRMQVRSMYLKDVELQLGSSDYDKMFYSDGSNTELINLVWGEHLHLKSQMPTDWMKDLSTDYHPHVYLKVLLAADPVSGDSKYTQFKIVIAGKKPFLMPPKQGTGRVYTMDEKNLTGDLRRLYDLHHQYEELEEKWDKISNDIITYLRSAKSLNSALKSWAELRAFIPQEFLDRVDAKPERTAERKKAEESLASIDRNLAVTSATLVKLATT